MGTTVNTVFGPGIPIEVSRIFTPLGIRFWDLTMNAPISDGLVVTLRLMNSPVAPLPAVLTPSGVYAFFGLPGLRAAEFPDGTGQFGPPRTFTYIVSVEDTQRRFLPEVLVYTLDQTGAVLANGIPDPIRGARLAYLFSAPTRPVPPGAGGVRAYLIDQDSQSPAAWAVVRVQVTGQPEVWTGIADDRGQVLVLIPYPLVDRLILNSPPGSGPGNVAGQSWALTVEVLYRPGKLTFPLANMSGVAWPFTVTPNLKGILEDQLPADISPDPGTPVAQLAASLHLGQDLILRSVSFSPPSMSSSLNISQGTSPP